MEEKERYVCKKISKDCLFPEILCELKDTESKFFVVLESKDDAVKIADLLNQQDKEIKQLKQSQKQLAISELEKSKDFIDHNIEIENDIGVLKLQEFYDNQIKKLKGEMCEKK